MIEIEQEEMAPDIIDINKIYAAYKELKQINERTLVLDDEIERIKKLINFFQLIALCSLILGLFTGFIVSIMFEKLALFPWLSCGIGVISSVSFLFIGHWVDKKRIKKIKNSAQYKDLDKQEAVLNAFIEKNKNILFNQSTLFSYLEDLEKIQISYEEKYSTHFINYCAEKHNANFKNIKRLFFSSYKEQNIQDYLFCIDNVKIIQKSISWYLENYFIYCKDDIEYQYEKTKTHRLTT